MLWETPVGLLSTKWNPEEETSVESGFAPTEQFQHKVMLLEEQALSSELGHSINKLQICLISSSLSNLERRLGTGPDTHR